MHGIQLSIAKPTKFFLKEMLLKHQTALGQSEISNVSLALLRK